ncbi:MAG: hypothetical protein NTU44_03710, partial [Bacteroidetes bacterium]|nr:hypothetical protein [Bacteroidota bacterium]
MNRLLYLVFIIGWFDFAAVSQSGIPSWQVPAANWRVILAISASDDSISPRAVTTLLSNLPSGFEPGCCSVFMSTGLEVGTDISKLGLEGFQLISILPPAIPDTPDTLFIYLLTGDQCDSLNLQGDTMWATAAVLDTNFNGLQDAILLNNNVISLRRTINETQQKLYIGIQPGKNRLKKQGDPNNYCSGLNTTGTSMTIRKRNTWTDYSIQLNQSVLQKTVRKSSAAAEITLKFAHQPGIPFTVYLRYILYRGLPFIQQSIFSIPDTSDISYFIPNDCPVYWAERSFYSPSSWYKQMYSDSYGWDTLWQRWNTDMRYFIMTDSLHNHSVGSLLHNKGVIRIYRPSTGYFDLFDSYGYHADGLSLRNVYGAGQADTLIRLFKAASLFHKQLGTDNRDGNILFPKNQEILPADDSIVVIVSTPAADSLHIPDMNIHLVSPSNQDYLLSAIPSQQYRYWKTIPFLIPQPADTGLWTIRVWIDTAVRESSIIIRNVIHPSVFFDTADVNRFRQVHTSGFYQTLWTGLLQEINSIRYYYSHGSEPVQTGANSKDIRGYEDRIQTLAFRLLVQWDSTDWQILRSYVFTMMSYPEWGYEEGDYPLPFNNLDLTHSHFLMGLSCAYDWLYEHWTQAERRQLREFIRKEANDWTNSSYGSWYMQQYPVIDWSTRSSLTNNHYWTNNAAIEIAGRLLKNEIPSAETDHWLEITQFNLQQIADALPVDGGSHEGPGYHAYGFQNLAKWMAARIRATGNTPVNNTLWLQRSPEYELASMVQGEMIPGGRYLLANFADCPMLGWAMPRYYMALTAHLEQDSLAQWITRNY